MIMGSEALGVKYDEGKPRMELVPPELMESVAKVLTHSAGKKYSARNWEKGLHWGRVYGALQRHLNTWNCISDSDVDAQSGMSHLWHAAACISFLITYEARKTGVDDRFADQGRDDGPF